MDISRSLARRLVPARVRAVLAVAVLSIAGTVAVVTATAAAAPQFRSAQPFMAGTDIGVCTAGLVLTDDTLFGKATQYRRSVRFILTAGHCGSVGDNFTTPSGQVVGDAIWKSPTHDFLLIKVEPELKRGGVIGCIPGSTNLNCVSISPRYYPRAVGRVFTGGPLTSESIPVPDTGQTSESICISGSRSGSFCGHTSTERPPNFPDRPGRQDTSFTRGPTSAGSGGDSGAPLYSSDGHVFGILNGNWWYADGSVEQEGLKYTEVSRFFAQQSGYALAPPR